jgi:putative pyrroloquinoline-quinone binding quinoprotein
MKKLLLAALTVLAVVPWSTGQSDVRVITCPKPLSREALARVNLDAQWLIKLKLDNSRDGIFSLQVIPAPPPAATKEGAAKEGAAKDGDAKDGEAKEGTAPAAAAPNSLGGLQIAVQTLLGDVILLDGETGDLLWRMPLPKPLAQPVGYNSRSIFVVRGDMLFVLNRTNGLHRVFSHFKDDPLPVYGYRLPATPSAPPVADDLGLFLAMSNRVVGYLFPDPESLALIKKKELDAKIISVITDKSSQQPIQTWTFETPGATVEQAPLVTANDVDVVTNTGNFLYLNRFISYERVAYRIRSSVIAPMNSYDDTAYIAAEDYTLYALDMKAPLLRWRFLSSAPIYRQPIVTDRDIYIVPERLGMSRLLRETGEEVWANRDAVQFLAVNPKIVYARDRRGNLLFLDALRGSILATFDLRDWTVVVANEWTDRIYVAAQDGQVLCLRHRDYAAPLKNRTIVGPKLDEGAETPDKEAPGKEAPGKEAPGKEAPKKEDMEKKNGEKKDDEKMGRLTPRPAPVWLAAHPWDRSPACPASGRQQACLTS